MASRPGGCARELDSRKAAQLGSVGAAIARLLEPQRKLQRGVVLVDVSGVAVGRQIDRRFHFGGLTGEPGGANGRHHTIA